ncbi:MAG: DUF5615 family PIN-like protein [Pseudonocardia sp.]
MHTSKLPDGNCTTDLRIAELADSEDRVVVTKNRDFRDGHLLSGSPHRLLVVATDNITNAALLAVFKSNLDAIVGALVPTTANRPGRPRYAAALAQVLDTRRHALDATSRTAGADPGPTELTRSNSSIGGSQSTIGKPGDKVGCRRDRITCGRRVQRRGVSMSGDLVALMNEMSPYLTAAVSAYGGAVLTRVQEDSADATVGWGRRILQRIFGTDPAEDRVPIALRELADDPTDADLQAALRVQIRKALAADEELAVEVIRMLTAAKQETSTASQGQVNSYASGHARVANLGQGNQYPRFDDTP